MPRPEIHIGINFSSPTGDDEVPQSESREPARYRPSESLIDYRDSLVSRYKKTYKSRLELEKRLSRELKQVEILVLTSSTCAMIVTIINLAAPNKPFEDTAIVVAIMSMLTLIGSLTISASNRRERSQKAFNTYRRIQRLRKELERLDLNSPTEAWPEKIASIEAQYEGLIDSSENHSENDYFRALAGEKKSSRAEKRKERSTCTEDTNQIKRRSSADKENRLTDRADQQMKSTPSTSAAAGGSRLWWCWFSASDFVRKYWRLAPLSLPAWILAKTFYNLDWLI
ncbi:SLATT domain-containing protein [Corynebacterium sp. HMSC08F01]|uniref:SLATT domain-containing protein n=1 Tax=Corynebacterium sp. HMSC08F01 TaxID=1581139 RepID=UPI00114C8928|nr:SLATT domain-containing protein [Corynebacterium sp. HMSC08F01]